MRRSGRLRGTVLALAAVAAVGSGCEWFENMADQPSVQTFEEPPLPPVAGTVPVAAELPPSVSFEVANVLTNPLEAAPAVLDEGRTLYAVYCEVCHGAGGAGDGPVVARFVRPPTLMGASRGYSDGYIYALITNGRGNMPSYNRMSPHERWAVIHYLRALQAGTAGTPAAPAAPEAPPGVQPTPAAAAPAPSPAAPGGAGAADAAPPDTGP